MSEPTPPGKRYDLTLRTVATQRELLDAWHPLHVQIFPDKDDQTSKADLREASRKAQNNFFLLQDTKNGKDVGVAWLEFDPAIGSSMYVPYGGVVASHRNKGIYPLMQREADAQMQRLGAKLCVFEVEDPKRIAQVYPDDNPRTVQRQTESRINFWRRMGAIIIRDPDIEYRRPASSDSQKIQAYDLMAVRPLDKQDSALSDMLNADKTAIRKSAVRKLYLDIMRLEYGNMPEPQLRKELPAVDQFLTVLDKSPKQWLSLQTNAVQPKLRPDAEVNLQTVAPSPRRRNYTALPAATQPTSGSATLDKMHQANIAVITGQASAPTRRRAGPRPAKNHG